MPHQPARAIELLHIGAVTSAVLRVAEDGDTASVRDRVEALAVMRGIADRNPDIQTVGIMDGRGTFLLDVDPSGNGVSGPQYDFFEQAMQGREFISGVTVSSITGKPGIFHSVPIRNAAGDVVSVLRARSSLSTVTGIVLAATDRLGFNADGALLDANGLVIANTLNDSWLLRPAVALAPTVEAPLANGSVWGRTSPRRQRWAIRSSRASSASNSRPCLTGGRRARTTTPSPCH